MLFVDLVGFTSFSEGRDPEDVRSLITDYFDIAREVIERFCGTVDKFIGDAVMAWWGATTSQEDDAERAVRSALEVVDAVSGLGDQMGIADLAFEFLLGHQGGYRIDDDDIHGGGSYQSFGDFEGLFAGIGL